jgi:hypothetical protein
MLTSFPHRLVVYVDDDQLAALRACIAREPYVDSIFLSGSISPTVRLLLAEALAARDVGERPARRTRRPARSARRR